MAAREQPEAIVQAACHSGQRHHFGAGRRQFDRQREPIEVGADVSDVQRILGGQLELGAYRADSRDEQLRGR